MTAALPVFASPADAADALRAGRLIAHATEGLYGIAADPLCPAALAALDALKGRAAGQGYVLIAANARDCEGWAAADAQVRALLAHDWPTPLTVVCAAGPQVPAPVRGEDGTVALRIDRHPASQAIGAQLQHPWVSTSLNLRGQPPARHWRDVPPALAQALAGALALGPEPRGVPSTLVRLAGGQLQIVREGELRLEAIQQVLASLAAAVAP